MAPNNKPPITQGSTFMCQKHGDIPTFNEHPSRGHN